MELIILVIFILIMVLISFSMPPRGGKNNSIEEAKQEWLEKNGYEKRTPKDKKFRKEEVVNDKTTVPNIVKDELKTFIDDISNRDELKISVLYAATMLLRDEFKNNGAESTVKILDGDITSDKVIVEQLILELRKTHKNLKDTGKNFYGNAYWLIIITFLTYLYDLTEERNIIWDILTEKNSKINEVYLNLELDGIKITSEIKRNNKYRPKK